MKKVVIPHELAVKFIRLEGLNGKMDRHEIMGFGGIKQYVPGETRYDIKLDLTEYPRALKCCLSWMNIITTYFQTSYSAYRISIGPYEGLYPTASYIEDNRNIVEFHVDAVDTRKKDWRDWFIQGDREIAL